MTGGIVLIMKRLFKTTAALLAVILLLSMLLTGCGEQNAVSIKGDAENYVKAVLDLICTGEYDHSVTFADVESVKERASRDAMISEIINYVAEDNDLTEEQRAELGGAIARAFTTCRYSIKDVKETDDGGCDVTVSIEPLMLFAGVSDALNQKVEELSTDTDNAISMTEEEQTAALAAVLFSQLNQNLDDPQYAPAEEAVVHYGLLQGTEDRYGIDANAGKVLGEKLFSSEGL